MVPPPARSARDELAILAGAPADGWGRGLEHLTPIDEPRDAAVLILFGVLDTSPSRADAGSSPVSRDLDVLLLARAATLRAHAGEIAFPGGRVDPTDTGPTAAALREAVEETGLDPAGVDVLGELGRIPLPYSRHLVTPVLAWWREPSPVGVVDVAESAHVFRVPVADLLDPANRGVTVFRRDGEQWRGAAFVVRDDGGEHLVWGFTAMVLDALFDRLGWTRPWDDARELPIPIPRPGP